MSAEIFAHKLVHTAWFGFSEVLKIYYILFLSYMKLSVFFPDNSYMIIHPAEDNWFTFDLLEWVIKTQSFPGFILLILKLKKRAHWNKNIIRLLIYEEKNTASSFEEDSNIRPRKHHKNSNFIVSNGKQHDLKFL